MQDNKCKYRFLLIVIAMAMLLSFALTIAIGIIKLNSNKVDARVQVDNDIFNSYDYVLSLGTVSTLRNDIISGDNNQSTTFTSCDNVYIGFVSTVNNVSCDIIFPSVYDYSDDPPVISEYKYEYKSRSIGKNISSSLDYVPFRQDFIDVALPCNYLYYNGVNVEYTYNHFTVNSINFSLPKEYFSYSGVSDLFNVVNGYAIQFYKNSNNELIYRISLLATASNFNSRIFDIYLDVTPYYDYLPSSTNILYVDYVLKYIPVINDSIPDVPDNDNSILTVFDSVVGGVSSFLNVEILPDFTLGNIFIIVLGVSFMGFLIHLIIK